MDWSARYIGIPFVDHGRSELGCDCYGLARLVYRLELGIMLPDYQGYASAEEHAEVAALIAGAAAGTDWLPCRGDRPFDIAVFRRGRLSSHVGIVVEPGLMLHMVDEDAAKIERIAGPWAARLMGFWRHVDVAVAS